MMPILGGSAAAVALPVMIIMMTMMAAPSRSVTAHSGATLTPKFKAREIGYLGNGFGGDVADLDGDGHLDVAVASRNLGQLMWLQNDGSNSFGRRNISSSLETPRSVYATDADGDGDEDLVVCYSGELVWWENDGAGSFVERSISTHSGLSGCWTAFPADADGDGDVDVATASIGADAVMWFENDGAMNFTDHMLGTSDNAHFVVFEDITSDGKADIVSTSANDDEVILWESDGGSPPSFTETVIASSIDYVLDIGPADLDEDGDTDIVVSSYNAQQVLWLENDGSQSFTTHVIGSSLDGAGSLVVEDFNSDGHLDVLLSVERDGAVVWFENAGNASFTQHILLATDRPTVVLGSDLDQDGDMDAVVVAADSGTIFWSENMNGTAIAEEDDDAICDKEMFCNGCTAVGTLALLAHGTVLAVGALRMFG